MTFRNHKLKILVIASHPDDAELSMAMTISNYVDEGHDVSILCMSRGGRGINSNKYKNLRKNEALNAGKVLGVTNYYFSDVEDTNFEGQRSLLKSEIEKYIQKLNPDVIYTHFPDDIHQDHVITSREVIIASRVVNTLYFFRSPNTQNFVPNSFFFGDEKLINKKHKALSCFKSQFNVSLELTKSISSTLAYNWMDFKSVVALKHSRGLKSNDEIYCEPFVLRKESQFSLAFNSNKSNVAFDLKQSISI